MKTFIKTLSFVCCLLFVSCEKPQDNDDVSAEEYKILFIGNSYTVDATEHLPGMIYAAGIKNIKLARSYHGGYSIQKYAANYDVPNIAAYHEKPLLLRKWIKKNNNDLTKSLKDIVESDVWDMVVLQEATHNAFAAEWSDEEKKAFDKIIGNIRTHQPDKDFKVAFMMTHALPENQYKYNIIHEVFGGSQERMWQAVVDFTQKVMSETECTVMIPMGTAIQNLRSSSLNDPERMDMTRDYAHLDYGIGRYCASCTVFETLISPVTGITLENNSYRDDTENALMGYVTTPINDKNVPIARRAAHEAVLSPYTVTQIP